MLDPAQHHPRAHLFLLGHLGNCQPCAHDAASRSRKPTAQLASSDVSELPARLPGHEQAVIDPAKLRDYCLCPDHETGRHKARVFASALGIGQEDWLYLATRLHRGLPDAPVTRIEPTPWGVRYEVVMMIDGLNGAEQSVKTGWMIDHGSDVPRLSSAYVDVP